MTEGIKCADCLSVRLQMTFIRIKIAVASVLTKCHLLWREVRYTHVTTKKVINLKLEKGVEIQDLKKQLQACVLFSGTRCQVMSNNTHNV